MACHVGRCAADRHTYFLVYAFQYLESFVEVRSCPCSGHRQRPIFAPSQVDEAAKFSPNVHAGTISRDLFEGWAGMEGCMSLAKFLRSLNLRLELDDR